MPPDGDHLAGDELHIPSGRIALTGAIGWVYLKRLSGDNLNPPYKVKQRAFTTYSCTSLIGRSYIIISQYTKSK
jgi:hypothetical protein